MIATSVNEVQRLKAVELEAEQRQEKAMERGDLSAARNAELDWIRSSDALSEYIAAHTEHLSR